MSYLLLHGTQGVGDSLQTHGRHAGLNGEVEEVIVRAVIGQLINIVGSKALDEVTYTSCFHVTNPLLNLSDIIFLTSGGIYRNRNDAHPDNPS